MKYIEVGKIVGTHGIKGEVKVNSDSSFKDERYKVGNVLYLNDQDKMIKIEINSYRPHKNLDLITFNNHTNINDVLKYVNCSIYVDEADLTELEEDEFYFEDLIDSNVVDDKGNEIGKIIDINEVPQGEILVIKKANGGKALIPFVNEFIKEIDLENKIVIITPIEGLL